MTAKEFLREYRRLKEKIRQLEIDIMKLEAEYDSVSIDYSGMPHGSGIADRTADLAVRITDLKQKRLDEKEKALAKCEEILAVLDLIESPLLSRLIYDRYILFMTWEQVAEDCEKSERWCRTRLHSRALQSVNKILDNSL